MIALPLPDALEGLRAPWATESFSPLTGAPVLVVDVSVDAPEPGPAAAAAALAELPCPTVALGADRASPCGAALLSAFDVHVQGEAEAAPVVEAAKRSPLAAMALVQLLRQNAGLDVHRGLVAESLVYSTLQSGPEFAAWLASREPAAAPPPNPEPAVLAHREGARLRLTLNRPERHNAFSAEMRDALAEALAVAVGDPSIEAIRLDGAGPSFSSGGDLLEFGTHPDPATAHAVRSTRNVGRLLARCADRLEARVQGACVGAGVELPAFAARVEARPDAWFQLPEVAMGLVPGAGGTVSLPRRIGRPRTAWLALTGRPIDAGTALAWGLVDEVR